MVSVGSDIVTTNAGGRWTCDVARTPDARTVGLQAYPQLGPDHGLIFEWPGESGQMRAFHQGTVPYPIRIVWVVANLITHVVDSRPGAKSNYQAKADWVLEVSATAPLAQSLYEGGTVYRQPAADWQPPQAKGQPANAPVKAASTRVAASFDLPVVKDLPQLIATLVAQLAANPTLLKWTSDAENGGASKHFVITRRFIRALCRVAGMQNELDIDLVTRAMMQPETLQSFADALVGAGIAMMVKAPATGVGLVLYSV